MPVLSIMMYFSKLSTWGAAVVSCGETDTSFCIKNYFEINVLGGTVAEITNGRLWNYKRVYFHPGSRIEARMRVRGS